MKMKKLLSIFLVIVLCLSVVLVSCKSNNDKGNNNENNESNNGNNETPKNEVNANPENDKKVIANQFSSGSIGDLLDKVDTESVQFDTSKLYDELAKISFSSDLNVETEWLSTVISVALKDGAFEIDADNEKMYMIVGSDFSMSTLEPFGNGYWVDVEETLPEDLDTDASAGSVAGMLNLPEEVLEIIKGFSFPTLDVKYIELDGDWYVIDEKYYENVAKAVLDLVVEISESYGEAPTDEEYNEALETVMGVVDALDLEIGFEVCGENVVGLMISVNADVEAIYDVVGSNSPEPAPYATADHAPAKSSDVLKMELELHLTDDASYLSSFSASFNISIEDVYARGDISFEYKYDDSRFTGITVKADLSTGDRNAPTKIKGDLSFGILYDKDNVCGVEVDVDVTLTNVEVGGNYYETSNDSEYVTCVGDVELDVSLLIDFSKISVVDGSVLKVNADVDVTGKSMYYETYDYYTSEYVKSTDMSIFVNTPDLSEFCATVSVVGSATTTSENQVSLSLRVSKGEDTPIRISGMLELDSVNNITLPAGINRDTIAEAYERIYAHAEMIAKEISNNFDYSNWENAGYYIYDAESGLYAYISNYGYVQNVGTVLPTDDYLTDRYGTYVEYGA